MLRKLIRVSCAFIALTMVSDSLANTCASRLFGSENDHDNLLIIDAQTGSATILAPFNMGEVVSSGLAFDAEGVLWGALVNETGDFLVTFDTNTGAIKSVLELDRTFGGRGIEFGPEGELFLVEDVSDSLYRVDPVDGSTEFVGSLGFNVLSLALSEFQEFFYSINLFQDRLVEVDFLAQVTDIGPLNLGFRNNMISLSRCPDENGLLYAADGRNDILVRIDPGTGQGSTIGSFNLGTVSVGGLAFEPEIARGLRVSPPTELEAVGTEGGPFSPSNVVYTLENGAAELIEYRVSKTQAWISLVDGLGPTDGPLVGMLGPGETAMVEIRINEIAGQLDAGQYQDTISFANETTGKGSTSLRASLEVFEFIIPNLLENGDFEGGDLGGWNVVLGGNGEVTVDEGAFDPPGPGLPASPCDGAYSALTYTDGPGSIVLFQQVRLPSSLRKATLSWTDGIRNHGQAFGEGQEFRVEVRDVQGNVLREVFSTDAGTGLLNGCTERNFDISEFIGVEVRIAFVQESLVSPMEVQLDNIVLRLTELNRGPVASAGPDARLECMDGGAPVTLDGSGSSDPDSTPGTNNDIVLWQWIVDVGGPMEALLGTGERLDVFLPLGVHEVTLIVVDALGATDQDAVQIIVEDTVAPTIDLSVQPTILWPPNHRMVDVVATVSASDQCASPEIVLSSVSSSELDDGPGLGDGHTVDDVQGAELQAFDAEFQLRAERAATGPGRTYLVTYAASDGVGLTADAQAAISVPVAMQGVAEPIHLNVSSDSSGTLIDWDDSLVSEYNVIRGRLEAVRILPQRIDLGHVVCIAASTPASQAVDTDPAGPEPGETVFYLVESVGQARSGYGTESASLPRMISTGDCP